MDLFCLFYETPTKMEGVSTDMNSSLSRPNSAPSYDGAIQGAVDEIHFVP